MPGGRREQGPEMTGARRRPAPVRRRGGLVGAGLLAGLGGLVLAASPAAAQVAFGLGFHGGVAQSVDADDTSVVGGVHARLRLLAFVGLEAAADYKQEEFADGVLEVNTLPVTLSVLLYPIPFGPLQPYLVGGIGWYYSELETSGGRKTDVSDVGVHAGAGLDVRLGEHWALHGDVRYIFRDLDTTEVGIAEQDGDGWQVRFGLTYYFW